MRQRISLEDIGVLTHMIQESLPTAEDLEAKKAEDVKQVPIAA